MKSSPTRISPEILRSVQHMGGPPSSSEGNGTTNPEANPGLAPNGPLSQADYECLVRSEKYGWMLD
ncbi:MAG: hypothetical protein HYY28_07825 [Betaproteobacteria bacterium]|nr:hypothetical protein [Betaproteobacteria bacterium]MBI2960204.1 hypothetical protein [Betaproteobacteria bacterium]